LCLNRPEINATTENTRWKQTPRWSRNGGGVKLGSPASIADCRATANASAQSRRYPATDQATDRYCAMFAVAVRAFKQF